MYEMIPVLLWIISGIIIGIVLMKILQFINVNNAKKEALQIVEKAKLEAITLEKSAVLEAKTVAHEYKIEAEKEIKNQRGVLQELEMQLLEREKTIDKKDIYIQGRQELLEKKEKDLDKKIDKIEIKEKTLDEKITAQVEVLENLASLSSREAKEELFTIVREKAANQMTAMVKEMEEEAQAKANGTARNILTLAIQRYANDAVAETTVSSVTLPSEDMKGRIIGREGRNIRAIEAATGVDLIIDDTPEVITVSCFNPIRREVARRSLELLIKDGRIQPGRIEEVVAKVQSELDETIYEAGEAAIFELGIPSMKRELIYLIGKLKYRTSYGQNALEHSLEVAHLAGMLAAEIGENQQLAKRAGLLHDIGKAIDFEQEGSHVELGAKYAKRLGENEIVINGIETHHGNKPPIGNIPILVTAADALSAARPGARAESLENYIQRLEELERITNSFNGVEHSFAIQAGREVRVIVQPDKLDDLACHKLASDIKERIENEMTYPGQIKVTVIRETRASDTAK